MTNQNEGWDTIEVPSKDEDNKIPHLLASLTSSFESLTFLLEVALDRDWETNII